LRRTSIRPPSLKFLEDKPNWNYSTSNLQPQENRPASPSRRPVTPR
jgi:hypothetical protein